MRTLDQWLSEYSVSHQNKTNQIIHKVCVPLIMLSLIGLIWLIPTPSFFPQHALFNWATLFLLGCILFYMSLKSLKFLIGSLIMVAPMIALCLYMYQTPGFPMLETCIVIFVVAWIFQFIGHKIEGKKPSFLQDLAFLLIGPLWVLNSFYKKLGINQ